MNNACVKLSRPQLKKIWVTAKQMLWSDEMLHLFVLCRTSKEHISQLTRSEAKTVIDDMMKCADQDSGYRANKKVDAMMRQEGMIIGCTPAQCDKIRYLMDDAGWTQGRLQEYLEKYGAQRLEDLTRTLANNLIEYLKNYIARMGRMVANGTQ